MKRAHQKLTTKGHEIRSQRQAKTRAALRGVSVPKDLTSTQQQTLKHMRTKKRRQFDPHEIPSI